MADAASIDSAIKTAGAFVGGGLALGGGAVGAASATAWPGSATIQASPASRRPRADC